MARTREQILENRRRLKNKYGQLFDSVSAILFQADPILIVFENPNINEYDPEAETILPRLQKCQDVEDALCVVYEEFVRWFDADNAGLREQYQQIAKDIWSLWQERRLRTNNSET